MTDILLIDASGIFHALWHVTGSDPNPTATATAIVAKIRALAGDRRSGVGICLDGKGKTFRHDIDPLYKANRSKDDRAPLYHQIDLAVETLKGDGFPMLQAEGFEADDVIATVVRTVAPVKRLTIHAPADSVTICSADKDLLQLVTPYVTVHSTRTGATIDAEAVKARFGVQPWQMVDLLTLVGDHADNVRGARGIGEKGAAALLSDYGNLDDVYAAIDAGATPNITPAMRTKLQEFREQMPLTRSLIQLRTDAPIDLAPLFEVRVPADVATFGDDDLNRPDYEGSTITMREADEQMADIGRAPEAKPETIPLIPKSEQTEAIGKARKVVDEDGHVVKDNLAMKPDPPTALAVVDAEPVNMEYERQLEPRNMAQAKELARILFDSRLFGDCGNPQAVMAKVLAGRELGIPAMASQRSFHIVEGRPTLAADAIRALVLKSGKAKSFRLVERTAKQATFTTTREGDDGPTSLTYTIDEALVALGGVIKKGSGWEKSPADMLVARASSKLARIVYPDVCAGLYSPEEF